jgi:hypothetical protein
MAEGGAPLSDKANVSAPISQRPITLTFSAQEAARLWSWVIDHGQFSRHREEAELLLRELQAARHRGEL